MSSNQDNSELQIQSNSSQISSRRRTAPPLDIDSYSRPPHPDEPIFEKNKKIRYCSQSNCSYKSSIVTNFRRHLQNIHDITNNPGESSIQLIGLEQLNDLLITTNGRTKEDLQSTIFRSYLDKDVCRKALVRLIVSGRLPLTIVEWPIFHAFTGVLNPNAKDVLPTSHNTVRADILSNWENEKVILQNQLRTAVSKINISLDIWTSPNRLLFLGIVAHYVRKDTQYLSKTLLGLRQIQAHSGEAQWDVLRTVLKEYQLLDDLGVIIGDNASTNDTLCRTISEWFRENREIEWNDEQQRIRCLGHIINLIVQSFLFSSFSLEELDSYDTQEFEGESLNQIQEQNRKDRFRTLGSIGKLHNIVVHIRSSAPRTAEFIEQSGKQIPLDNRTRWNSWFSMISTSTKLEKEIDYYIKNHSDLKKDTLTDQDWNWLRTTELFLKVFKDVTLDNEGDQTDLSNSLPSLFVLKWHIKTYISQFEKKKVRTRSIYIE
jgi:hypothetical protein